MIRSLITIAGALAFAVPAASQTPPRAAKAEVVRGVESRAKLSQVINDQLFSYAEIGFQEHETGRFLTALLEEHGFAIDRDVADLPTGWVARWTNGTGGPVIALGSDIDGIPKASQTPGIPWHQPMVDGAPGHGEGHNSGQAMNIVAALAVKDWMVRTQTPGTLVIWPGVAEELLGGKARFVRAGVFKDVDAVIFSHVSSQLATSWGRPNGTGMVSVEYTFEGKSAHAAGAPWRGRSALDGVIAMADGWEMRREHLRPVQRSHYVISEGGDQPNVVPSEAKIWFYLREMDFEAINEMLATADAVADGAAKMTNTTVSRQILGVAATQHFNRPMAEAAHANIVAVGLPEWDANDQAFARAVQENVGATVKTGLPTELAAFGPPPKEPKSAGSDDIGDVSWTVPTITIRYPANIPGLPGHNWANAIAMATPIAHKGVQAGAKVMAMTVVDLLTRPKLMAEAKRYFREVQTKDQNYVSMLAQDDAPPTWLNSETTTRYTPELQKHYYDPEQYGSYLEQLGVEWPTLTRPEK
ncbi:amidohydrolase [Altererythrobacter sp. C41]|uniref:amidohydrolase n=1 Tax=Altererythrobacter sp. C41 TaxID=2806021 RepID=UPI001932210B|nr:amidohydrolase [Altererythrobacter sp. C41]MBM0170694.1 amidohydrolase [Altererythrobacter sp. C41]